MVAGAPAKVVGAEAKFLRECGHQVEAIFVGGSELPENSEYQDYLNGLEFRFLSKEFPMIRRFGFKFPFFSFFSAYHLLSPYLAPQALSRSKYDVAIIHTTLTWLAVHKMCSAGGVPYVTYDWDTLSGMLEKIHVDRMPPRLAAIMKVLALKEDRRIASESQNVIAGAISEQKKLMEITGQRFKVVYPGCFPVETLPSTREHFVLAIDRWDLGMDPTFLLRVIDKIKARNVKLRIAGSWRPEGRKGPFIRLRDRLGLSDRVEILGRVTEGELNSLYRTAKVHVHPQYDNVSMPVLEAAANGCPSITPRGTDLFTHGLNAFFPKEGDVDEYAHYLDLLLSDEQLAKRMGQEAWKVAKQHTWKHHGESLLEILGSMKLRPKDPDQHD